jgi:hypothetical protein
MSAEGMRQVVVTAFAIAMGVLFLLWVPRGFSNPRATEVRQTSGAVTQATTKAAAQGRSLATAYPEQLALIAKHEVAPGLTRKTAIDAIGTCDLSWGDSGPDVLSENGRLNGIYNGQASLHGFLLTPEMVKASWGEPDAASENRLGWEYIYREPPDGEIHLTFYNGVKPMDNWCTGVETLLSAGYFEKRFPVWTDAQCSLVAAGKIVLGMPKEQARFSWGEPDDINRTVGSWGVHEQWVYSDTGTYLYFENGILTSWQD